MTSSLVVRTDLSGTSFVLDVSALELSSSLSTLDFEVTHNGVVNNSYTKTSQTQLTYSGASVVLGTRIIARRITNVSGSETTFISTTTASALTNALDKLRLRTEELDARLTYTLGQILQGGITLGSIPINDAVYSAAWDNDTTNAASKNAVYDKIQTLASLASPVFTGTPTAPTAASTTNTTQLATTAFVKAQHPSIQTNAGERSFVLPNGLIAKYGSTVITIASNIATINFSTTPAFTTVVTALVSNGDSNASPTGVNIQILNSAGFVINTPALASGSFRINYLVLGT